jgi:hypothetical protein
MHGHDDTGSLFQNLIIFGINNMGRINKSPSETLQMLEEVYGKMVMKKTQVYELYKRFL